jgi:hypothetical protein
MAAPGSLVDRLDADVEGADVGATTSAIFPPLSRTIPLDMSISESTGKLREKFVQIDSRGFTFAEEPVFKILGAEQGFDSRATMASNSMLPRMLLGLRPQAHQPGFV